VNCLRCGNDIPEGSQSCPGCGLKLKAAPVPAVPQGVPPVPGQPTAGQPAQAYPPAQGTGGPVAPATGGYPPAPPEGYIRPQPGGYPPQAPGGFQPQGPPPGVPPFQQGPGMPPGAQPGPYYQSPGEIPPPPPGPYVSPGEVGLPGQYPTYGPGVNQYGQAQAARPREGLPRALIAFILIGVLVIAGAAASYFMILKKHEPSAPEAAVLKYFEVLPTGDIAAIKAMFAPDAQPSDENLSYIQKALKLAPGVKYEDVKLATVSETATAATVQLKDFTVAVTMGGQTVRQNLSTFLGGAKVVINLKYENGQWLLVANKGALPNISNFPGSP